MTSDITIPGYNNATRVPGVYFALDNSRANTASGARRILIIGQKLKSAPGKTGDAVRDVGTNVAINNYGDGSQIVKILTAYRQLDSGGEVWLLPLDDEEGSQPSTATLTIDGTAASSGTLPVYIDDTLVTVSVMRGDSGAAIIANCLERIQQTSGLSITASVQDNNLTLTAQNAGLCGNDMNLAVALLGTAGGQSVPDGLTVTTTTFSGGTQNPLLDGILSTQSNRVYDLILTPYYDLASLTSYQQWLSNDNGRWSPMEQLYGQVIVSARGTYGQLTALTLKNDPHVTIVPASDSPSSPLSWTGWIGARVAVSMRNNPALPVTQLTLPALAPSSLGTFNHDQRNSLLYDGISTTTVSDDGNVTIERLITTYRTDTAGNPDNSYLDVERLLTAQVCLQDLNQFLWEQCGASILLQNGAKIPAGIRATTPDLIKQTVVSRYRTQCENLWAQNPDEFSKNVVVEYAGEGTVKMLLPYIFADQLWVLAGNAQFLSAS